MRITRFFSPAALAVGANLPLEAAAARHAARVLRLRVGDPLVLFDGRGGEYSARITSVERDAVIVETVDWHAVERESPLAITLVQGLQAGEKMDLTVQKAVELGVTRIIPVGTRRSVVRLSGERAARRVEHWRNIVQSACEQCGRNRVPEVAEIQSLEQWLALGAPERGLLLDPEAGRGLREIGPPSGGSLVIVIGAEGGLAPEESDLCRAAGYLPVRLGPRVLRTETAGLAALAAIQNLWGDFA